MTTIDLDLGSGEIAHFYFKTCGKCGGTGLVPSERGRQVAQKKCRVCRGYGRVRVDTDVQLELIRLADLVEELTKKLSEVGQ